MKLISETELKNLLIKSEILRRLEAGGVDNWDWYYESLNNVSNFDNEETLEDWTENNLDNIIKKYPDYTITELDNYNFD